MKNRILKIGATIYLSFLPILASAQFGQTKEILSNLKYILLTYLIPMAFSLALLYFFYGVAQYVRSAGDKEEGKKIMWWGVIALFVMSSVWGLVWFIQDELDLSTSTEGVIPTLITQ